jgi:hypothetical protein
MAQNLVERSGWQVARRDEARTTHLRYRKQLVDGFYRLHAGEVSDAYRHSLGQVGVTALLAEVRVATVRSELVHYAWLRHP